MTKFPKSIFKKSLVGFCITLTICLGAGFFYFVRADSRILDHFREPFVAHDDACHREGWSLRDGEPEAVVAGLVRELRYGGTGDRYGAAYCLGRIGAAAAAAVPALAEAALDSATVNAFEIDYFFSSTVGDAAINALGRIGAAGAPSLLELQSDTDAAVREAAFDALSRVFPDPGQGVPFFAGALHSPRPEERRIAARLLREYLPEAREAVAPLLMAMGDEDARVRAAAARGLGRVAEEDLSIVAPMLIDAMADEAVVREATIVAFRGLYRRYQNHERIAEIGPKQVEILIAGIESDEPEMRRRSIWIVRAIGPSAEGAMPAVIAALDDEDVNVRSAAIRALYRFPDHARQVVPTLLNLLNDTRTARRARIVLNEIGVDLR